MQTKKFKITNESFVCAQCREEVPKTSGTAPRNHCPFCLWSRHVDINPGDRANSCRGMMEPIGIYIHTKKSYVVLHQCARCGERVRAKAILADKSAADDFDRILELSDRSIEEEKTNASRAAHRARRVFRSSRRARTR